MLEQSINRGNLYDVDMYFEGFKIESANKARYNGQNGEFHEFYIKNSLGNIKIISTSEIRRNEKSGKLEIDIEKKEIIRPCEPGYELAESIYNGNIKNNLMIMKEGAD